ncbi:uncharacterized protein KGF55_004349 [Candida pseudojiufengensis]|uniref:uncharacterized protein n=1 Tax=Candida pseudojiufengensis TaxID=497109 RepID=UPI00222501B9|nr:uncharacterized protein KGF55_004349 [Candida pseudojiufengensis]KAI5960779.1 hypothetical protein KGF55_004349 [Candida pseudojiufengensis]
MSQQDIITQVSPESSYSNNLSTTNTAAHNGSEDQLSETYNSLIHLNVRGKNFTITRDELMSLPESILLCLFPNGVFLDINGQIITNLTENDVVYVNFDPSCFQYIIDTFAKAQRDLETSPYNNNQLSPTISNNRHVNQQENILQTKPAIIVLREDLDFYVIPPIEGLDMTQMKELKRGVSKVLLRNKLIFSGLGYKFTDDELYQYNDHDSLNDEKLQDANSKQDNSKGLGPAEQHLFDMLCSSGFEVKDKWGSRSLEPGKCVISSLSLVRLRTNSQQDKTPTPTPPESPTLTPVTSTTSNNGNSRSRSRSRIAQLASSASRAASRSLSSKRNSNKVDQNQTKLLLFWRKPARKCWWSHGWINIALDKSNLSVIEKANDGNDKINLKVHVRRVWTLELSVIGVQ